MKEKYYNEMVILVLESCWKCFCLFFRLMFWVEVENLKIGKVVMDGIFKEFIVISDIIWLNGIVIDYISKLFSLYCFYELLFDCKIKVFKKYII